jgi:hypothetical protein
MSGRLGLYVPNPDGFGLRIMSQGVFTKFSTIPGLLETAHGNLWSDHNGAVNADSSALKFAAHSQGTCNILSENRTCKYKSVASFYTEINECLLPASPYCVLFANFRASSSVLNVFTQRTGPKISCLYTFASSFGFKKITGLI